MLSLVCQCRCRFGSHAEILLSGACWVADLKINPFQTLTLTLSLQHAGTPLCTPSFHKYERYALQPSKYLCIREYVHTYLHLPINIGS